MTFHGREWLPIPEAAKYLSEKSEENWRKQHVYMALLDRRLPLVARLFSGTKDSFGKEVEGLVNVQIRGAAKQYLECLEHKVHEPGEPISYVKTDRTVVERDGEEHYLGRVPDEHSAFPSGTQLGVRVEALEAFIQQMPPKSSDALDKPLGEKERTTLLVIIGALAEKAKIDVLHPTTAAKTIMRYVELLGAKLSRQTIERKLKLVPDAVEKHKTLKQ